MIKLPLVSIIINCYNGEKFLKDCLDSITSQSYKNWEIIFWDNCSTDNSKHILDASVLNDSPFILESNSSKTHFFLDSSFKLNQNFFENSKIDIKLENVSNDAYLKSNDITSPIINSQNTLKSTFNLEKVKKVKS